MINNLADPSSCTDESLNIATKKLKEKLKTGRQFGYGLNSNANIGVIHAVLGRIEIELEKRSY